MNTAYPNLNLRGGSRARLAVLREVAANTNAPDVNLPPSRRFGDWRAVRESFVSVESYEGLNHGRQSDGTEIWYTHGPAQFRNERYADEVEGVRIDHTGWFVDDDQHEKTRGIVAGLTHGRYLAGYEDTGGARVYFGRAYDDEREAARAADQIAERTADDEREHNRRWRAAQNLENDMAECKVEIARLFAVRNHRTLGADAREALAFAVDSLRGMRARRADEFSDIE